MLTPLWVQISKSACNDYVMEDGSQTLDRMREREQKDGNLIQEYRKMYNRDEVKESYQSSLTLWKWMAKSFL